MSTLELLSLGLFLKNQQDELSGIICSAQYSISPGTERCQSCSCQTRGQSRGPFVSSLNSRTLLVELHVGEAALLLGLGRLQTLGHGLGLRAQVCKQLAAANAGP